MLVCVLIPALLKAVLLVLARRMLTYKRVALIANANSTLRVFAMISIAQSLLQCCSHTLRSLWAEMHQIGCSVQMFSLSHSDIIDAMSYFWYISL